MPVTGRRTYRRSLLWLAALTLLSAVPSIVPRAARGQEALVESFDVDPSKGDGTTTTRALSPLKSYRIEVTGIYRYSASALGLLLADAECSTNGTSPAFERNRYGAAFTSPDDPKDDPLDLYVSVLAPGLSLFVERYWQPKKGTETGDDDNCSTAHSYELFAGRLPDGAQLGDSNALVQLPTDARLNFRVVEPGPQDNLGRLSVKIFEVAQPQLVATATVPANSPAQVFATQPGTTTRYRLLAGKTYRMEVTGTYVYTSGPNFTADAECSIAGTDTTWREDRYGVILTPLDPLDDPLDLYMNAKPQTWSPADEPGAKCSTAGHVYELTFVPQSDQEVSFHVYEPGSYGDNSGSLSVKVWLIPLDNAAGEAVQVPDPQTVLGPILDPIGGALPHVITPPNLDATLNPPPVKETQVADAVVPANSSTGVWAHRLNDVACNPPAGQAPTPSTPGCFMFAKGTTYRFEVSGTYGFMTIGNALADGECSFLGDSWQKDRYGPTVTPLDPLDDPLDLYVNGANVDWTPKTDTGGGCNASGHLYNFTYAPAEDNKGARFNVYEFGYGDNSGSLSVKVYRQEEILLETVIVDARDADGTTTLAEVKPNRIYRFLVSGTFLYSGGLWLGYESDAECTRTGYDPVWHPHRWDFAGFGDLTDLQINRNPNPATNPDPEWVPKIPDSTDPSSPRSKCNSTNHVYERWTSFSKKQRPTLLVHDVEENMDNRGVLLVRIYECSTQGLTSLSPCYNPNLSNQP